eukprot:5796005-Amphidinium_carterae.1
MPVRSSTTAPTAPHVGSDYDSAESQAEPSSESSEAGSASSAAPRAAGCPTVEKKGIARSAQGGVLNVAPKYLRGFIILSTPVALMPSVMAMAQATSLRSD